ncbi:MAG: hypothetical protein SOZ92_05055 [Porphyromonas somerae]|nr:hypothetical protein [Porphyromonas somerae]
MGTRYAKTYRKPMSVYTIAVAGFAFLLIPFTLLLIYLRMLREKPAQIIVYIIDY